MKIKVKKEMRVDELIKWARENPELSQGRIFFAKGFSDGVVRFQSNTNTCSTESFIAIDIPFTVEYEEEITEETKFDRLVEMEKDGDLTIWENRSIKSLVADFSFAYYILNDDLTMTLIWKDGRLVE
ncbi:TPA: hypothetical protein ACHHOD_001856 [Staphylococcus aureus]|uniref:hypothetical protein n=1 Tax=Staphylococcus aureus TaxID=1280 RepID=UPI0013A7069E|nr:hypothetical protein [Staphylococcus aureus]MBH4580127.1 hypothetical protein [Staphylococcus aureus]MBH4583789.1 hypothetical protein [Staphylococcus aureus]MBH4586407.1 hypothetical protein [Staphylococcus aureus]MBH4588919.1 hypothetical protein [Staphylococcus aureus]MBH4591622.1 hypothetical protein [Staphylococcus aureus]